MTTRAATLDKRVTAELTEQERASFLGHCSRRIERGKVVYICQRVELNAMTTPQLVGYIDAGVIKHGAKKKMAPLN